MTTFCKQNEFGMKFHSSGKRNFGRAILSHTHINRGDSLDTLVLMVQHLITEGHETKPYSFLHTKQNLSNTVDSPHSKSFLLCGEINVLIFHLPPPKLYLITPFPPTLSIYSSPVSPHWLLCLGTLQHQVLLPVPPAIEQGCQGVQCSCHGYS